MIHLVYPHHPSVPMAPWTIGRHLTEELRSAGHVVAQHDWRDQITISPEPGDILIGHPHTSGSRAFCDSIRENGWARTVAIQPWGGLRDDTDLLSMIRCRVDAAALICGPYWAERIPAEWAGWATPVDMAIDPNEQPRLIQAGFHAPGDRRWLYVGCTVESKGTALLPELQLGQLGHIGHGRVDDAINYGYMDIRAPRAREIISGYDFLICPGVNDANPTVVLEALCWGLLPVVLPTCGWGDDVAVVARTRDTFERLQCASRMELVAELSLRRKSLAQYTWGRFGGIIKGLL